MPAMLERNATFLDAADRIGSRLCRDAIHFDGRCNWVGSSMDIVGASWTAVERAFGADLYAGTSGIALVLAQLYRSTRESMHRDVAKGAVAQSRSQVDRLRATGIGFYVGLTGVAYAWTEIDTVFGDGLLSEAACALLDDVAASEISVAGLDVVSGCAGVIPALLRLARRLDRPALGEVALRCGERLISTARPRERGMSWQTLQVPTIDDLTGFSHGVAGVAWALLELYSATNDQRFLRAAEAGFDYERGWYNAGQQNWPDLRILDGQTTTPDRQPGYGLAWCHGAPGIGLSRLRAYALTSNQVYREEAGAAVRATLRGLHSTSYDQNYSLCHGMFGNADLLIESGLAFDDATLTDEARALGMRALHRHHHDDEPWPCGVPKGNEAPGLMLGLAGIAYYYLRLYDARKHPSLLLITPQD